MAVRICGVEKNSPAGKKGILPGENLLSINGQEIRDILDYRFYETSSCVTLAVQGKDGAVREIPIRKGEYHPLGLQFDTYLMDKQQRCRNNCIFCFIDQLPKGMRPSLYFKDDDSRLSFLFGNYITLTNLEERDIDRIIQMHISPINISVHTTNPELRVKMMGNRFAGEVLRWLDKLARAGTKMNCQLVLCPGINDGEELTRTLMDLKKYYPAVESIAAVPLGLTKHREGLTPLRAYTAEEAVQVIRQVDEFGQLCKAEFGERIAYAADEFYIQAGAPFPPASFYGPLNQLEDGVGMVSLLREEFLEEMEFVGNLPHKRAVSLATGTAAAPILTELLDRLGRICHNLNWKVFEIKNDFLGHSITVAGLVTGGDLIRQLRGNELGEELLIPASMLRAEGDLFLDDVTLRDVEQALGVPVRPVPNDGAALLRMVLGLENRS